MFEGANTPVNIILFVTEHFSRYKNLRVELLSKIVG